MQKNFDLVVLGTGTAGSAAASQCRAAGWSVAIVDSRPFGGTCALRGCDPKKVLVGSPRRHRRPARDRCASGGIDLDVLRGMGLGVA